MVGDNDDLYQTSVKPSAADTNQKLERFLHARTVQQINHLLVIRNVTETESYSDDNLKTVNVIKYQCEKIKGDSDMPLTQLIARLETNQFYT